MPLDRRGPHSLVDLETNRHSGSEFSHVCDDANHSPRLPEILDCRGDGLKRLWVQRAKAFVQEECVEQGRSFGSKVSNLVRKSKREREGRLKGFAAGQGACRAHLVCVGVIDHHELLIAKGEGELVARELAKRVRGVENEELERLFDKPLWKTVRLEEVAQRSGNLRSLVEVLDLHTENLGFGDSRADRLRLCQ